MELREFIQLAKINTYASNSNHTISSRPQSFDLSFSAGPYRYLDSYFGGRDFIGEEVVYKDDKAVWGMNYYGRTLKEPVDYSFLKEALKHCPLEAPYRGPSSFSQGAYRYSCTSAGDLDSFSGEEKIFLNDVLVYVLSFHGGSIKI